MDALRFAALQNQWLALSCEQHPIRAAGLGIDAFGETLGDFEEGSVRSFHQRYLDILRDLEGVHLDDLPQRRRHDLLMLRADAGRQCLLHDLQPHRRAPYIYPERVGQALHLLLGAESRPTHVTAERVLNCLEQVPGLFSAAMDNLVAEDVPAEWCKMGLSSTEGLLRFLQDNLGQLASSPGLDVPRFEDALAKAGGAAGDFRSFLSDMEGSCGGVFAAGPEHVESMLEQFHLLPDVDCGALYRFGEDKVAEYEELMHRYAGMIAPGEDWRVALEQLKDDHPDPADLLSAYQEARDAALHHVLEHQLITVPDGQDCAVAETPSYLRSSIPLGVMNVTPPFAKDDFSRLLITPIDVTGDPDSYRDHLREQNYGFIRSITFHEIYPGHHLQSVLHKQVAGPIRKTFRSPLFVEGWGLYTEDLMEETGFLDTPALKFFQARNALWRALRIIIDVGLHTGEMGADEAASLLSERVGQGSHMARGEVLRYTRHDNATYQSCYMYGKTMIMELREKYREALGPAFTLRGFHDQLCAHGSPPVSLVEEILLGDVNQSDREGE